MFSASAAQPRLLLDDGDWCLLGRFKRDVAGSDWFMFDWSPQRPSENLENKEVAVRLEIQTGVVMVVTMKHLAYSTYAVWRIDVIQC